MRDPARIPKILKKIEEIWKDHPDLRFMQLLYALEFITKRLDPNTKTLSVDDPFYTEDDIIQALLDDLPNNLRLKK